MKKNCDNCKHLSWDSGDINDPEGFACHKRDYFKKGDPLQNEINHQALLDKSSYRYTAKKCCDPIFTTQPLHDKGD